MSHRKCLDHPQQPVPCLHSLNLCWMRESGPVSLAASMPCRLQAYLLPSYLCSVSNTTCRLGSTCSLWNLVLSHLWLMASLCLWNLRCPWIKFLLVSLGKTVSKALCPVLTSMSSNRPDFAQPNSQNGIKDKYAQTSNRPGT